MLYRTCLHLLPTETSHHHPLQFPCLRCSPCRGMAFFGVQRLVAVMATGKKKACASCDYQCLVKEHTIKFLSLPTGWTHPGKKMYFHTTSLITAPCCFEVCPFACNKKILFIAIPGSRTEIGFSRKVSPRSQKEGRCLFLWPTCCLSKQRNKSLFAWGQIKVTTCLKPVFVVYYLLLLPLAAALFKDL